MKKQQKLNIDPSKKRLFTVLMLLTPVLLLLLVEFALRVFNYGGNQRLFVTGPEEQISHYWMCNQYVGKRYFYALGSTPSPPKDLFLKEKPENGYRIFVLGGSTTAGFPYSYNVMFPRILSVRLADIFPDRHIEVVNTAMSAVNSYTLYDFMDEILAQEPDALLIYAGHNEFYGAMGVGSQERLGNSPQFIYAYMKLRRFKLFMLIRDIVGSLKKNMNRVAADESEIDPSNTLMARIVAEKNIPYKSELYERGIEQYENNLSRILEKAGAHNVPVIVSELVSNIKDQKPFVSVKADTFPTANRAYEIGQKLLEQGDYKDARTALTLAKDLDALRFRATEEMNDIIHGLAEEYAVPVVPMKHIFEQNSEHQMIGNELILEHLHPNIKGYFLMADGFLNSMRNHGFVEKQWPESTVRSWQDYLQDWGLTAVDSATADLKIHYLKGGWPFQPTAMRNRALDNYRITTRLDSVALKVLVDENFNEIAGHIEMGRYYENRSQYDKAFQEYKAAYYAIPFELDFYENAARVLVKARRFEEALQILLASQRYGSTPFTNKWTGLLLASAEQFGRAVPFLEKAYADLPEDSDVLRNLVASLENSGQSERAQQLAPSLRDQSNESAEITEPIMDEGKRELVYSVLMKQATEFLKQKDYEKALPMLKKAYTLKQTAFTAKWIGMLDLNFGRLEEGVQLLETAAQEMPQDFELYYNLCNGYIALGNKQEAERVLQEMEKIRPNFKDPQNLRGRVANLK